MNQALEKPVSQRTVQRPLDENGYYACTGKRKPLVSEVNRIKRRSFVRTVWNWTNEWNEIIFNDESRFALFLNDSHKWET